MNYHTEKTGPDSNGIRDTLKKALKICKNEKREQMGLAVHTKNNLKANTIVDAFGEKNIKIISKNNGATVNGIKLFLITERIDPIDFEEGPILAIDISIDFLEKLANDRRITDIIYKPWRDKELEEYLESFDSSVI